MDVQTDGMEYMEQNIASWKAFEKLYQEGKIKSIGVSNFQPRHLEVLIKNTTIVPMVNQILLNPNVVPYENIEYCNKHNILIEAYSPLATGRILDDERLARVAKNITGVLHKYVSDGASKRFLTSSKIKTPSRIKENLRCSILRYLKRTCYLLKRSRVAKILGQVIIDLSFFNNGKQKTQDPLRFCYNYLHGRL